MLLPKRICKTCNVEKSRVKMGTFPGGRTARFVDEKMQFWNGKICPDCNLERVRNKMNALREKRKNVST